MNNILKQLEEDKRRLERMISSIKCIVEYKTYCENLTSELSLVKEELVEISAVEPELNKIVEEKEELTREYRLLDDEVQERRKKLLNLESRMRTLDVKYQKGLIMKNEIEVCANLMNSLAETQKSRLEVMRMTAREINSLEDKIEENTNEKQIKVKKLESKEKELSSKIDKIIDFTYNDGLIELDDEMLRNFEGSLKEITNLEKMEQRRVERFKSKRKNWFEMSDIVEEREKIMSELPIYLQITNSPKRDKKEKNRGKIEKNEIDIRETVEDFINRVKLRIREIEEEDEESEFLSIENIKFKLLNKGINWRGNNFNKIGNTYYMVESTDSNFYERLCDVEDFLTEEIKKMNEREEKLSKVFDKRVRIKRSKEQKMKEMMDEEIEREELWKRAMAFFLNQEYTSPVALAESLSISLTDANNVLQRGIGEKLIGAVYSTAKKGHRILKNKNVEKIKDSLIQAVETGKEILSTPVKSFGSVVDKSPKETVTPGIDSSEKKRKLDKFESSLSQDPFDYEGVKVSSISNPIAQKKKKIYRDPSKILP